jgi:hypothetical protein
MHGRAENFDFFRQPDFVEDPFLKGSYAVYKKETLLGEGTGKLCHIHRPEIIDARGRRCWGDLAVTGNELHITIPEWWLSNAKYPVIVDPTIGTSTIGSQYKWVQDVGEDPIQLMFEGRIAVNRFLVSDTINGLCTAYMYSYVDNYDEAGGRPVLYSDNGNSPSTRKSMNEGFADFTVNKSKPAGWRSATFNSNGNIASGSYIWFGVFVDFYWETRFDYGAKCYDGVWYDYGDSIPYSYPHYDVNWFYDFKLSMYFTYTLAQNYVRTITQGVTLTDTRKLTGNYNRSLAQTVQANSTIKRLQTLFRNMQELVKGYDTFSFPVLFMRTAQETVTNNDAMRHIASYLRELSDTAKIESKAESGWILFTKISDTVHAAGAVFRGLMLFVRIVSRAFVRDYILGHFLRAREELILKSAISREIILDSKIS